MYIPASPFLEICYLFSLFSSALSSKQIWRTLPDDKVIWFSKGRWALKELCSAFIQSKAKTSGTVLIPEYFCEASLKPLRSSNLNLLFYRINPLLEPDINYLDAIIKKQGVPDILLFVHYFGLPLDLKPAAKWCDKHGVLLVEDAAHAMPSVPGIGDNGCPTIYTPWKFFNLLEGALLVLPQKLEALIEEPPAKKDYSRYFWKWLTKRIVHTLAGRVNLPIHKFKKTHVNKQNQARILANSESSAACSSSFVSILAKFEEKMENVRFLREQNFRRLDKAFSGNSFAAEPLFSSLPDNFGPYLYPLRIRNGCSKDVTVALNQEGVPALSWGDLSPEVLNMPDFPLSNALRRDVLTLPVHQHITQSQIDRMAQEIISRL